MMENLPNHKRWIRMVKPQVGRAGRVAAEYPDGGRQTTEEHPLEAMPSRSGPGTFVPKVLSESFLKTRSRNRKRIAS